jgi:hypothetical protein
MSKKKKKKKNPNIGKGEDFVQLSCTEMNKKKKIETKHFSIFICAKHSQNLLKCVIHTVEPK